MRYPGAQARAHLAALRTQAFSKNDTPEPDLPDPQSGGDFTLLLAQSALDRQIGSIDSLDSKASTLAATALGLIGLVTSVLALKSDKGVSGAIVGLIAASGGLAIAIGALTLLATRPVHWQTGPRIADVVDRFRQEGVRQELLVWRTIESLNHGFQQNAVGTSAKAWAYQICLVLLALETVCSAVALFLIARI